MIFTLAPSKDVPRVPIRYHHHPSVESPVKAGPGPMAVVEAEIGPPTYLPLNLSAYFEMLPNFLSSCREQVARAVTS